MRYLTTAALLMSACSSVVPSTALRLNAVSPLEADPADFAVAITLPQGLGIAPQSAKIRLHVSRSDTGENRSDVFVLDRQDGLQTIYRIAPSDHDRLRAAQALAMQWNTQNDSATSGSLSVALAPCKIGDGPADDARVNVAVQLDAGGPFRLLVRNGPLSAVAAPDELRKMMACP